MPRIFSGKKEIYLQIADRYAEFIRMGLLKDGDKLPSVRTAAGELGVNPNTVQKAYVYLEEQGLICSLPKKGVFVTVSQDEATLDTEHLKALYRIVSDLKNKGITRKQIENVLKEVYADD